MWDGRTGKFVATLRGHIGAVYRLTWSADSRLLVSASKDSTVKVRLHWNMALQMVGSYVGVDLGSQNVQIEDGPTGTYRRGVLCRLRGG